MTNWDDAKEIGVYAGPAPPGIGRDTILGVTISGSTQYKVQIVYPDAFSNCSAQREMPTNEIWGAWEWVNPPMQLGIEYRTTERYIGKPVYVKVVQAFSSLTGSDAVDVCEVSVDNADKCISCTGETSENWSLPSDVIGGANNHIYIGAYVYNANTIKIMARTDRPNWPKAIRVTIKYTKTTD